MSLFNFTRLFYNWSKFFAVSNPFQTINILNKLNHWLTFLYSYTVLYYIKSLTENIFPNNIMTGSSKNDSTVSDEYLQSQGVVRVVAGVGLIRTDKQPLSLPTSLANFCSAIWCSSSSWHKSYKIVLLNFKLPVTRCNKNNDQSFYHVKLNLFKYCLVKSCT